MWAMPKLIHTTLSCLLLLTLVACGGDSSNTITAAGRGGSSPATITISLTDAAVDNAREVWVQFTGLSIKPAASPAINFTFDTVKNINLLDLQGTRFTDLISNIVIPTGSYNWIRLDVNAANDGINDTYIMLNNGNIYELWIPSGRQTGLKINSGFELLANENLNLIVDFDLRKSIILRNGNYKLRPSLRMMRKRNTGTITGIISPTLLTAPNCSDTDPATGNAIYLFAGATAIPDDLSNANPGPVTSARIRLNTRSGNYRYIIGYVPAGDYTLAFTCQADMDDPDTNDNIIFSFTASITVTADSANLNLPVIIPGPVR